MRDTHFVPTVICSKSKDLFQVIKSLREKVWRQEGAFIDPTEKRNMISDENDLSAFHYSVIIEGKLAAAARLSLHNTPASLPDSHLLADFMHQFEFPIASFNRMVVDPNFRGLLLPHLLDLARLQTLTSLEAKAAVTMAVTKRVRSMGEIGFKLIGKVQKSDEFMKSVTTDFHCLQYSQSNSPLPANNSWRYPAIFDLPEAERP